MNVGVEAVEIDDLSFPTYFRLTAIVYSSVTMESISHECNSITSKHVLC